MSESTNTAVRKRLEALIGEPATEAGPPGGPPWPGAGRVTFEWLDGVPLVIERSNRGRVGRRATRTGDPR